MPAFEPPTNLPPDAASRRGCGCVTHLHISEGYNHCSADRFGAALTVGEFDDSFRNDIACASHRFGDAKVITGAPKCLVENRDSFRVESLPV